ncbi:MAG: polysaccharide pyruvyl transferase family protein [Methyloprofundus sp.]|nr:polysaccharide pyruvyl transferase family protein [Methyloprofundus sp.]
MRKIAFFGITGHTRYTYADTMHHSDAMPRSSGTGITNVLELYEETGNKGNMLHGEAPTRIFQMDRSGSCYVSAKSLIVDLAWSTDQVAAELSKKFDLVVFSTANMIRPDFDPGGTAAILEALSIEFVVLGMGMQSPLPASTDSLHPGLIALLDVCNKKANVFGVRGFATEKWLKSVGFDNAKALGCPSLYVYPQNILNIQAPDPHIIKSALTGGYISARTPRSQAIINLFKDANAHYVMQDEIDALSSLTELNEAPYLYNDASGELNKDLMESMLEKIHYKAMPFTSYRWFQDPNAWRLFASQCDVFIGDRLHGGVAALQSGVPAILISEDQRVTEVATFNGIPTVSTEEIKGMPLADVVDKHLSAENIQYFKETYFNRFQNFQDTFKNMDITLTVSAIAPEKLSHAPKKPRSPMQTRMNIMQQILKKLT